MNDNLLEKIHDIRKGELNVAMEAAKDALAILKEYYESHYDIELLKKYAPFYFKDVAILQNAMVRFGMCDYLLEE